MTATPPPATSRSALSAFASRDFALLWFGNLLSNTGAWMQQVAEPWLVLRLSGSPVLLGLDAFALDAPIWVFILLGGVLADRSDRRRVALCFQGIQWLCPVLLVVLLFTGHIRVWMVILLSLVVGITDGLSMPSIQSLAPSLVTEQDVPSAIALNSAQFNVSRVLGPLLAGVAMAAWGTIACFALNAASYVPFLLALFFLRIRSTGTDAAVDGPGGSLLAALRTVARRPPLSRALLTVLISSILCAPTVTFLPVLIRDAFHLGSTHFGGALSVLGFGGLVGVSAVVSLKRNAQRQTLATVAALALGLLTLSMALDRSFGLLLLLVFLAGTAMVASNTAANSIIQSSIDSGLRGRLSSIFTLAIRGGMPLGNLATGFTVSRFGVRNGLLINGVLAIICQASLLVLARRHAPDFPEQAAPRDDALLEP